MSGNLRRLVFPGVILLSLLLLAGGLYFRDQGQEIFKPPEEEGGEVSGTTTEMPIYQPSVVVSRSELKESREITFETGEALAEVVSFYERELVSRGFEVMDTAKTLGSTLLKFSHPDGRRLEITLETEAVSGKTIATLYLTIP